MSNLPIARPIVVKDDERFLKWLARAQEAKPRSAAPPVEVEETAAVADPAPQQHSIDNIPEAIIVKQRTGGRPASGRAAPARRGRLRPVGGDLPGAKLPEVSASIDLAPAESERPAQLDIARITSMEDYNEGRTNVEPLKRNTTQDGTSALERPNFREGELPRSVERGVLHPQPGRLVATAALSLIAKLLLIAVVITLPVVSLIDARELIPKIVPLLVASLIFGVMFVSSANKTRCRVCSCHLFYVRHCLKHKSSHKVPLIGYASSAALHLLLFRWMRCMYCGTALRLRGSSGIGKPKKGGANSQASAGE